MFTINDYILVSRNGILYKSSIENFKTMFLPVNDNDMVQAITDTIDDISSYILELSSTMIRNYSTIDQLNQKYETLLSTDAILEDGSILVEEDIEKKIAESQIVTKEKAEDSYASVVDKCEREFDSAQNKMDSQWFD